MNRLKSLVVLGLFMVAGFVVAFVTGSADGFIHERLDGPRPVN